MGATRLYLNYGRAAFRLSDVKFDDRALQFAPVCFVVRKDKIPTPTAAFPFDSGGFLTNLYSEVLPHAAELQDFLLVGGLSDVRRLIGVHYGNNQAYLHGKPIADFNFGSMHMGHNTYATIIRHFSSASKKVDLRCSSIELQLEENLPFPDAFEALILPSQFLMDGAGTAKMLKDSGLKLIPYNVTGMNSADAYSREIEQFTLDHYRAAGHV